MTIPHDKFCVLPWISLETSPIGTVRPCCLANDEIVNDDGVKITLGETPFDHIRNTKHMRDLRCQFLSQQRPDTCRRCWAEEDAGRTSKRQHTLDRLKHIISNTDWTEDPKPLMFLDLKLGNICNLKCRICGSWSSSTFASEEIKFQRDKKNNFHYVMLKMGQWPRQQQTFWQELRQNLHTLRYLEFTGGEPFMIQEHFDLLLDLVTAGHAKQVEIHYNTNGTIYPEGAENIWSHFKHVEIAFSIDDVGARFEYQRSGAQWLKVNENIEKFKKLRLKHKNISLQVCTTVNAFNVMYLADVADWIDHQGFDFVYWNMLHDGPQFCISNLPIMAKNTAAARLKAAKISPRHHHDIDRIIDFMYNGTQDLGEELCTSIKLVDQRRGQNLLVVAPELAQALHYET
jgi:MoaA/NifB/PqqE/SkfB family radical SAM enzyme